MVSFVAGRKAYSLTWALQYVNLFMINTGFIILAGQGLKVDIIQMVPITILFYQNSEIGKKQSLDIENFG